MDAQEPLIVSFLSQKGGVRKSTFAQMLAREYALNGWRVAIAEFDPDQGTSTAWANGRQANGFYPDIEVKTYVKEVKALDDDKGTNEKERQSVAQIPDIQKAVADAANFDLVIIDSRGFASPQTLEAAKASDVIFVPSDQTKASRSSTLSLIYEFKHEGIDVSKIAVPMTQIGKSKARIIEAQEWFEATKIKTLEHCVRLVTTYELDQERGRALTECRILTLRQDAIGLAQDMVDFVEACRASRERTGA